MIKNAREFKDMEIGTHFIIENPFIPEDIVVLIHKHENEIFLESTESGSYTFKLGDDVSNWNIRVLPETDPRYDKEFVKTATEINNIFDNVVKHLKKGGATDPATLFNVMGVSEGGKEK